MHVALTSALALLLSAAPVVPAPVLRVGLINTEGSPTVAADAERMATYFGKALGRPVTSKVYTTYGALAADFATARVDLAWLPPALTVPAIVAGATLVAKLVRGSNASYLSVLFTRADSPVTDLRKLKKATIAWVDKSSSAGYLFPGAAMVKEKLPVRQMLGKQLFLGNHRAVCEAVLKKTALLGATFANPGVGGQPVTATGCELALGAEAAGKFKILLTSDPIPSDALAARPGCDEQLVKDLTQVATAMSTTAEGRQLLETVFHADSLAAAKESDYEPVAAALESSGRLPH